MAPSEEEEKEKATQTNQKPPKKLERNTPEEKEKRHRRKRENALGSTEAERKNGRIHWQKYWGMKKQVNNKRKKKTTQTKCPQCFYQVGPNQQCGNYEPEQHYDPQQFQTIQRERLKTYEDMMDAQSKTPDC